MGDTSVFSMSRPSVNASLRWGDRVGQEAEMQTD